MPREQRLMIAMTRTTTKVLELSDKDLKLLAQACVEAASHHVSFLDGTITDELFTYHAQMVSKYGALRTRIFRVQRDKRTKP
jgi:hypothetical protein